MVCNFKIRYVLKEAFAAVPFRINPSNVTGALDRTFQFRRGVLFQRFVIASGSFVASSELKSVSKSFIPYSWWLGQYSFPGEHFQIKHCPNKHCPNKHCPIKHCPQALPKQALPKKAKARDSARITSRCWQLRSQHLSRAFIIQIHLVPPEFSLRMKFSKLRNPG